MATLEITDHSLVVTVEGIDKLFTLRSSIAVPLSHISGVTARPDISKVMYMPVETKFRGVHSPGSLLAGTIVMADGSGAVFCDVHDQTRALAIDLHHDDYKRLIIEVSDQTPEAARDMIIAAVGARLPPARVEGDRMPDQPRVVEGVARR